MNKVRIYHLLGDPYTKYGILEQILNKKKTFITLFEQGDDDFWFTEDKNQHPSINIDEWFSSLTDAENYLKKFSNKELVLIEETKINLDWK